jgi:hypothetical protein
MLAGKTIPVFNHGRMRRDFAASTIFIRAWFNP